MLVYDKKVPRHIWKIPTVMELLDILIVKGAIVRIKKANAILKRSLNNLFRIEHIYYDNKQTEKTREQKLRC